MSPFLKLIRLPNLLIIVLTQYLIRYLVLQKLLQPDIQDAVQFEFQLSHLDFFLLTLSTVMVAAGGYIINDYFDTRTDLINRPDTVVIDRGIDRRTAIIAHLLITGLAVAIGFYVAYKAGLLRLGFIHVFGAALLWFYSTDFKRQVLIGNVVVSLLTALVPVIVVLYELYPISKFYSPVLREAGGNLNFIFYYAGAFSFFAFMVSMVREIIKDMEDVEGDRATGCKTVPISWGMKTAKAIVFLFDIATIMALGIILSELGEEDKVSFYYILLGLIFPLLILLYKVFLAETPLHFHNASMLAKFIMLAGVCYSFIIYFTF